MKNLPIIFSMIIPCTSLAAKPSLEFDPYAPAEQCIIPAARYHKVNDVILESILRAESSMRSNIVTKNTNNTVDVGIGGINSVHFNELARYSISPADLLKPCNGVYVAAWHLSNQYKKFGNTWYAIGAYHSTTPQFNQQYQIRVANQIDSVQKTRASQAQRYTAVVKQDLLKLATNQKENYDR